MISQSVRDPWAIQWFLSVADSFVSQFFGRLLTQASQVSSFCVHAYHKYVTGLRVIAETEDHTSLDEDYLTRDEFSLHKMIVVVSNVAKVSKGLMH